VSFVESLVEAGATPPPPEVARILERLHADRGPLTVDRLPWALSTQLAEPERVLVADWFVDWTARQMVDAGYGETVDELVDEVRQTVAVIAGGRWW
jgi:hypothetical protein